MSAPYPSQFDQSAQAVNKVRPKSARIITISSGKQGVGKSTISINLAVELSGYKKRVCLFDADTHLTNTHIMTGRKPSNTLEQLLDGKKPLNEVMLRGPAGIYIIPVAKGLSNWENYNAEQQQQMIDLIRQLELSFDYILIDTAAGISEVVLRFLQAAQEILLIITTDPKSSSDAFLLLRKLSKTGFKQKLGVLVNRAGSSKQAKDVMLRFAGTVRKYLGIKIKVPGYVLEDRNVPRSSMVQRPLVLMYPNSAASRCIGNIADQINELIVQRPFSFSNFLNEQKKPDKIEPVEPVLSTQKPWMNELVDTIRTGSFKEVEQMMADIAEVWLGRIEQESHKSQFIHPDNFRTALKLARKMSN